MDPCEEPEASTYASTPLNRYTAVGSDNLPLDTLGHQDLHGSLAQRGLRDGLQIVGMSATLPNLDVVARYGDS